MLQHDTQPAAAGKLLSVAVAAYNGESTLAKALDSCLTAGAERLEVLVVNDGSTDGTARLARQYVQRRPDVFRLIDQKNGGYGSAVTAALHAAQGRYFRTLDCDDWFDPQALASLLKQLEHCTADVVMTNYRTVQNGLVRRTFDVCAGRRAGCVYSFEDLGGAPLDLEIHGMTFLTQVLHAAGISLPHRRSYTDMAYTFLGLAAAQTLVFYPLPLYHYRLGRDGQSVSLASYQKHFDDYVEVTRLILDRADALPAGAKGDLLRARARDIAQYGIELLLRFPAGGGIRAQLRRYDGMLRSQHPAVASRMKNKNTRLLRATGYACYPLMQWWAKRKTHAQTTRRGPWKPTNPSRS